MDRLRGRRHGNCLQRETTFGATARSQQRAVAAAIDWVSGLSELPAEKSPISVHPNPARHEVWVTNHDPQPGRWTLFNLQGQVVRIGALTPWINIELDGLADGMFMLRVDTEGSAPSTLPILKQH